MAVTYITRIYATIDKSIDYIIRDKTILKDMEDINNNDVDIKGDKVILRNKAMQQQLGNEALSVADRYIDNALDYIERDKEVLSTDDVVEIRKTLTSSLNCHYDSAKNEFEIVRETYANASKKGVGKNDREILGYHVWQSFEETIDGELANQIGVKLAKEMYGDYQCVISTHTNTVHTHNHIVFNAVSVNGNKYNICTENTRKLREVSDRLCEEHGLSVLQHTKGMKLKWYKDEQGNWKCFEPTERKLQKNKGEYANKNDYRNYEAYIKSEQFKTNQRDIVRNDIDKLIPNCTNLDDLISKLEDIGYEVKNLKKTGQELMYISFKSPTGDAFLRGKDNSLGEAYTRENIIKRIEEANRNKNDLNVGLEQTEQALHRNQYLIYDYNNTNIEEIDEEKRKRLNKNSNTFEWVRRSELEKYIIKDVKILNHRLDRLYNNSQYQRVQESRYYGKDRRHKKVVDRINDNLRALQFIENKNITSFQQINDTVQSLYEKNEQIDVELSKIRDFLKEMNTDIVLIKQYNDLKHSIVVNSDNEEYVTFELQGEQALLEKYEQILKARKLIIAEQQADYVAKVQDYNKRYSELVQAKERINKMISQYDMTVRIIDRVDRNYDRKYRTDIKEYYEIGLKENKQREKESRDNIEK